MLKRMTQEKLSALIGKFLGKPPQKDHDGDCYILSELQLKPANVGFERAGDEPRPTKIEVVVKFILSNKDNGNVQSLELVCFSPAFPDKPNPLKLDEGRYSEAVRFCSGLPMHVVPHVKSYFARGSFYVKTDIENPGVLPDEWFVEHWLKPNFSAAVTAFMLIGKKFAVLA